MINIDELLKTLIPLNDYSHRNGFNNESLINQLSTDEKLLVEDALISLLIKNATDMLIIDTLVHLNSKKSLPLLNSLLEKNSDIMRNIIIATSIHQLNPEDRLVNIAIENFCLLQSEYTIIPAFFYLKKLNNEKARDLIRKYTNDSNYLISYNANQAIQQ